MEMILPEVIGFLTIFPKGCCPLVDRYLDVDEDQRLLLNQFILSVLLKKFHMDQVYLRTKIHSQKYLKGIGWLVCDTHFPSTILHKMIYSESCC